MILIDLDNFKALNGTYGYAKGDAVLSDVAAIILHNQRASDLVGRYGGEELALIMPDCPLDQALAMVEKFRGQIEALASLHQARISASFGVVSYSENSANCEGLLASADAALYQAKASGRNCVEWAASPV